IDLAVARGGRDNRDGIDADAAEAAWMRKAPGGGEPAQAGKLRHRDGFERMPERNTRPGFHLDEHELVAVSCHKVDLTLVTAPVALDYLVTSTPQVVRRDLL